MFNEILSSIGARVLKESKRNRNICDLDATLSELGIDFSKEYKNLLKLYEGSIVFEKGAKYKPDIISPLADQNGFQSLEMLYGLSGEYNLIKRNKMYRQQIPSNMTVIGEGVGGDQICISKDDGKIYYWHHEAITENRSTFEISSNLDDFIFSLEEDNDSSHKKRINESESFFDF
jgi:hypothetical protein